MMKHYLLTALMGSMMLSGGEMAKYSLERSYGGKKHRRHDLQQNNNVEYYTDEKGQLKRRKKPCQSR